MPKSLEIYGKIEKLGEKFLRLSVEKSELLGLINSSEVAEQVYNSNAIENSTLSLDETERILLKVDLDRYISERELFEAKNLARVVEYISHKAKEKELDKEIILLLHRMLILNIRDDIAGRFRNENEWVKVGNYIAVDPKLVGKKIQEMLIDYYSTPTEHIVKRIARFHLMFEHIHPFVDGNGRIGRVLNNYLLIREGYVPINIKFADRKMYYTAFREFDTNKSTKTMEEIVGKALTNSFYKRIAYMEGKDIMRLSDYAKKNDLSHSNLINKAKRQTIPAFMEKGVWKIGD